MQYVLLCIALSLFFTLSHQAQINAKWKPSTNGDWFNATNWVNGVVPNNSSFAVTIDAVGVRIYVSQPLLVGSLTVDTTDFTNEPVVTIQFTTLTVASLTIGWGKVVFNQSTVNPIAPDSSITVKQHSFLELHRSNTSINILSSSTGLVSLFDGSMVNNVTNSGGYIEVDSDSSITTLTASSGQVTVAPSATLTVKTLNLQGAELKGNGTQGTDSVILITDTFTWESGRISNAVTVLSLASASFTTSSDKQFSGATFQNNGTLSWWAGQVISGATQSVFINNNLVTCYNATNSGVFNVNVNTEIGTLRNLGTFACDQSPSSGLILKYWDVYSSGTWTGGIDNSANVLGAGSGGGSWWFNAGTVFDDTKPISFFGYSDTYYVNIPFEWNSISFLGTGTVYLLANVSANTLGLDSVTILGDSMDPIWFKVLSGISIAGGSSTPILSNCTLLISESVTTINWNPAEIAARGTATIINYATIDWQAASGYSKLDIDADASFINYGTVSFSGTGLSFTIRKDQVSLGSGTFYNYGTITVQDQLGLTFQDSVKYYQCSSGSLVFPIASVNSVNYLTVPVITFTDKFNLDGTIRIDFPPNSTIANQLSIYGLPYFKWTGIANGTTVGSYMMFNGNVGYNVTLTNSPIALYICWNSDGATGTGTVYKILSFLSHTCKAPVFTHVSKCPNQTPYPAPPTYVPETPTVTVPQPLSPPVVVNPPNMPTPVTAPSSKVLPPSSAPVLSAWFSLLLVLIILLV